MVQSERKFQVIHGGTGGGRGDIYVDTGVVDGQGKPVLRRTSGSPPGDGGDGVKSIFKLDVHRDVQWMKALWALLIPASAWFVFYFVGEMKDVRKDIAGVNANVSGLNSTVNDMNAGIGRIEDRLDSKPSTANTKK